VAKHRAKSSGKHDADAAKEAELSKVVADALAKAKPKAKPKTVEEMRRVVEGEK